MKDYNILAGKHNNSYRFFPKLSYVYPDFSSDNNEKFFRAFTEHVNIIKKKVPVETSKEAILRTLSNVSTLLLETTEECNLRCRYCVYSGKFDNKRVHGKEKMSGSTARSAIDFFYRWVIEYKNLRTLPYALVLGFYGGEPLLNFDLVQNAVDYFNFVYEKNILSMGLKHSITGFSITTNGLLLNKDIIEFLVKYDFRLTLSIDGPKKIQDRNKGKGNYDTIIKILEGIRSDFYEFFKNNVSYSIVYDRDTDLKEVRDFFSQDLFEESGTLNFGYVNDFFSDIEQKTFGLNEQAVLEKIFAKLTKKEPLSKIEQSILSQNMEFRLDRFGVKSVIGGYCTLGSKRIFVTINGDFFGCEKTSDRYKIGGIDNGFDVQRIKEIEESWIKETEICVDCILQGCCHACVANIGGDNKFDFQDYCNKMRNLFYEKFPYYIQYKKLL